MPFASIVPFSAGCEDDRSQADDGRCGDLTNMKKVTDSPLNRWMKIVQIESNQRKTCE
jgi:hypothetical protein